MNEDHLYWKTIANTNKCIKNLTLFWKYFKCGWNFYIRIYITGIYFKTIYYKKKTRFNYLEFK